MATHDFTLSSTPTRIPRVSLGEAIRRHWVIALLPVLALVAAGVALGLSRTPAYTAETRLTVGNVDLSQPGALGAYTTGSESLAAAYSRAVDAEAVVAPVAKALHAPTEFVRSQISATPVPKSPVFRLDATAASPEMAVRLANLSARSLQRFILELNRPGDRSAALYDDYQRAALEYSKALDEQLQLDRQGDRAALVRAEAKTKAANVRLTALQNSYVQAVNASSSSPAAQVLTKAADPSSDRNPRLQLYIFIGILAGALAGAVLATAVANRNIRRSISAP